MSIKDCTVLVGVDWADKKHVCAVKIKVKLGLTIN